MGKPSHRIVWDTYAIRNSRSKRDILVERSEFLLEELNRIQSELVGQNFTPCNLTCDGCGTVLETEADFAAHFIITDEAYLNLGNCPNSKRNRV